MGTKYRNYYELICPEEAARLIRTLVYQDEDWWKVEDLMIRWYFAQLEEEGVEVYETEHDSSGVPVGVVCMA